MKKRSAFFIAIRYLWGRAHEGGRYLRGAAAGIAVSLVPIIVTLIVADGMIRGITDRYLELGTGHIQVFNFFTNESEDDVIKKIKEINGIRGVWQEHRAMGVLAGREGRQGVTVRSIDSSFWDEQGSGKFLEIIEGGYKPDSERAIVLGAALASGLGVKTGDIVRLMTVRNDDNGRLLPRSASFIVTGIVSSGYNEIDALWCIIGLDGAARIFMQDQSSSSLIVKIDEPYEKADLYAWEIFKKLGTGYNVYTWKEILRSQYSSYETTKQLLMFIMALIVLVAAVNVSSATSMLALERQKDIAILKISGACVGGVMKVFIFGSLLTGLAGTLIGTAAGLLIGVNINFLIRSLEKTLNFFSGIFRGGEIRILDPGFYLETIPIIVDWNSVLLIAIFTIVCSAISSLIPARRAGKLKPMELLRKT